MKSSREANQSLDNGQYMIDESIEFQKSIESRNVQVTQSISQDQPREEIGVMNSEIPDSIRARTLFGRNNQMSPKMF